MKNQEKFSTHIKKILNSHEKGNQLTSIQKRLYEQLRKGSLTKMEVGGQKGDLSPYHFSSFADPSRKIAFKSILLYYPSRREKGFLLSQQQPSQ